MPKDSESLFRMLVKSSTTAEKRLVIDIRATQEPYERGEITKIGWIRSKYSVSDGRTKITQCDVLDNLMKNGTLDTQTEQWIERATPSDRINSTISSYDLTSTKEKAPSVDIRNKDKKGRTIRVNTLLTTERTKTLLTGN